MIGAILSREVTVKSKVGVALVITLSVALSNCTVLPTSSAVVVINSSLFFASVFVGEAADAFP